MATVQEIRTSPFIFNLEKTQLKHGEPIYMMAKGISMEILEWEVILLFLFIQKCRWQWTHLFLFNTCITVYGVSILSWVISYIIAIFFNDLISVSNWKAWKNLLKISFCICHYYISAAIRFKCFQTFPVSTLFYFKAIYDTFIICTITKYIINIRFT